LKAEMAAVTPSPTAVPIWRGEFWRISPAAKTPGVEV